MSHTLLGIAVVALAGIFMGGGGWPIKLMRKFSFEHWFLLANIIGLLLIPWAVTLWGCPHALEAYAEIWQNTPGVLIKSNLFSLCQGFANILCCLCYVRIGFALTGGILTGIGVSLGVTIPMIFKGTGLFKQAPDLTSNAGLTVLAGVCVMLIGVVLVSMAGFGREKKLAKEDKRHGSFLSGLLLVIASGLLSCSISFSFVYSQGPIVSAMKSRGADDISANFAVWAVGMLGCALINIVYPCILLTVNHTWRHFLKSKLETVLTIILGANTAIAIALMGRGMLLLGPLGASVGFGVQQAMQMTGSQGVGFIGGEWKGVYGRPRHLMYLAIACLLTAAAIMAYGNSLAA